jgi:D-arabinose 1-dehydrogenase-like Zn-dependent alcohol dehydrogenase
MTAFREPLEIVDIPEPAPGAHEVVVRVEAEGICRSDWHAWNGDWDWVGLSPSLPLIPGHELGGVIEAVGSEVREYAVGDRVTVPFHEGCGHCPYCRNGRTNLCDNLEFIGFTHDGGYAEYTKILNADFNCVRLPEGVDSLTAAAIGCRYMTAYHAVTNRGNVRPGQWVAVHGVGGVGLSAVQIAASIGAQTIAIDIDDRKLEKARAEGAVAGVNGSNSDVSEAIREISHGGVHISIAALGRHEMVVKSVASLRKGGRHVQVGLTSQEERGVVGLPIDMMIEAEIEFVGSVGNPHGQYPELLALIELGRLNPRSLITREIELSEVNQVIAAMTNYDTIGFNIITRFQKTAELGGIREAPIARRVPPGP